MFNFVDPHTKKSVGHVSRRKQLEMMDKPNTAESSRFRLSLVPVGGGLLALILWAVPTGPTRKGYLFQARSYKRVGILRVDV